MRLQITIMKMALKLCCVFLLESEPSWIEATSPKNYSGPFCYHRRSLVLPTHVTDFSK